MENKVVEEKIECKNDKEIEPTEKEISEMIEKRKEILINVNK